MGAEEGREIQPDVTEVEGVVSTRTARTGGGRSALVAVIRRCKQQQVLGRRSTTCTSPLSASQTGWGAGGVRWWVLLQQRSKQQ